MKPSLNPRVIRVFISSTFRDFAEERDLLVKKVFPELRRRCRDRQVEVVDVDLRWGITEEQAQRGEILPICLAEIERARPYFIGLIGERYGWIPTKDQYASPLLQQHPWLVEHCGGKSVTELEMLHGVLNNPAMTNRAFFYFRSPHYSHQKGGQYLSDDLDEIGKLSDLKDRIRGSGLLVMENYSTPEMLAEHVQEAMWQIIDTTFPQDELPDEHSLERRMHDAYGAARTRMYIGGSGYYRILREWMTRSEGFQSMLVTGISGSGKSALIANWTQDWLASYPDTLLFVHYVGASSDAANALKLVARLIREIAHITGDELILANDAQVLLDMLPEWLVRASSYAKKTGRHWVFVFDGLDKLTTFRDLRWWPTILPSGIKVLASCVEGELQSLLRGRMEWSELPVNPLNRDESRFLICDYLSRYRKSLTSGEEEKLLCHPHSGNPLFLCTLLEELRVFGVYEEVEERLSRYLISSTVDELFDQVLQRIEQDTTTSAVRTSLEAIWASRAGLTQSELLGITGLVAATWAPIYNSLGDAILECDGRLTFGHSYLRRAVEDRYLREGKREAHRKLAGWFDHQDVCARVAEELPWQWQRADEKDLLMQCLTQREMFILCQERDPLELLSYWLGLGMQSQLGVIYSRALAAWEHSGDCKDAGLLIQTAQFLAFAGILDEDVKAIYQRGIKSEVPSDIEGKRRNLRNKREYAEFLRNRSEFSEAVELLTEVSDVYREIFSEDDVDYRAVSTTLATILWNQCRLEESEMILRALIEIDQTSTTLAKKNIEPAYTLGLVLNARGRYSEAIVMLNRVAETADLYLGKSSIMAQYARFFMAKAMFLEGLVDESLVVFDAFLHWLESHFGDRHPHREWPRFWIAQVMLVKGNLDAAECILREDLIAGLERDGIQHHETLAAQAAVADVLIRKEQFQEAEALLRECVEVGAEKFEDRGNSMHADVMGYRLSLAKACFGAGKFEEAESLASCVAAYFLNLGGEQHWDWKEASSFLARIRGDTQIS